MSKKNELLSSNHTAQIKWMDGQIAKNNSSIFINAGLAEKAWRKLQHKNKGVIDEQDVEVFMSRYLSKSGADKLYITLRVAETRAKKAGFRLQCNIDYSANQKLEKMMRQIGQSKGDLLSRLIEQATVIEGNELHCNNIIAGEYQEELQEELQLDEWHMYTKFSQVKPGTVMRMVDSGIEHIVYDRADKTILFEDGEHRYCSQENLNLRDVAENAAPIQHKAVGYFFVDYNKETGLHILTEHLRKRYPEDEIISGASNIEILKVDDLEKSKLVMDEKENGNSVEDEEENTKDTVRAGLQKFIKLRENR